MCTFLETWNLPAEFFQSNCAVTGKTHLTVATVELIVDISKPVKHAWPKIADQLFVHFSVICSQLFLLCQRLYIWAVMDGSIEQGAVWTRRRDMCVDVGREGVGGWHRREEHGKSSGMERSRGSHSCFDVR